MESIYTKNKIIYHVIEKQPEDTKKINLNNDTKDNLSIKRINSLKRIEQSYDETIKAIKGQSQPDDYYMLSDSDEIPKIDKKYRIFCTIIIHWSEYPPNMLISFNLNIYV